jgi:DNA-binding CsgD family transcriptional regulator/tetratricopeptide (TPR) repeat protein
MDSFAAPSARAIGRSDGPTLGAPPFLVGRMREQAALREALATAVGGHGRLVLVGGEAGIGKTTLARDLTRVADDLGIRILAGSCYDLTNTPPYGPWLDLFDACQRNPELPTPPDAFAGGQLKRVPDQAALFGEVRQFFAALTAARPALVILEDLHWADPASVDLLRHVEPHLRHWPVLLLATYRADELAPSLPFAQHLPALVREADAIRLDLHRLDAAVLRDLIASQVNLTKSDEDRLIAYLKQHAEGNPFFATELLRTLEEESLLRQDDGGWKLAALDRVVVPPLLRQVIDGRVNRLGEQTRKPLALAAVIGQEVPLGLWAEVADLAEEDLLDIVEQAVAAHLLEAERDGTHVRFVHALTREALYEGILPPRRRTWHRRVAEAFLASPDPDPDAVAFHLQEAGDPRAWEWLVKASDRAHRAYAWVTAAERLQEAILLLGDITGQERTRARLACRIAYLKRFSDPAGSIAALGDAERAARFDEAAMIFEVQWITGIFHCYADRFRIGLEVMERSLNAFESMPPEIAWTVDSVQEFVSHTILGTPSDAPPEDELAIDRLRAARLHFRNGPKLWFVASAGRSHYVVDVGERFNALLAQGPGVKGVLRFAKGFADYGLGTAYAALGQPDTARQAFSRSRELLGEFDHHAVLALSLLDEARDVARTYGAADPVTRRRLASEAEAALGRAGGALAPGLSPRLAWLGCFVLDGRWQEALQILSDLPAPGNAYLRREATSARAVLARHRGEPELAWAQIRGLLPDGPATEPGDIIHQEGLFLQRIAADLCLDAGDLPRARAWLEANEAWLDWSESILGRADGQVAWSRYHRATGNMDLARSCSAEALALAATPDQPLVRLAAHRLFGELETQAGNYAEAEPYLNVALELATACDVPFERALTLLTLAELRLVTGATGEAARLLEEVRRICVPLGAAPTLARADALAARYSLRSPIEPPPGGLTQRELDVLRLLVAGRSNPQIAEALFISRDTARTHVANIFRKLDVSTRAEAVDHAHRHGLLASLPPSPT